MKNFDLMENQPTLTHSSYQFIPKDHELTDFKGKNIPLLSNISDAGLTALMKKGKALKYVKEEIITSQTNTNSLIIIFYGKVSVVGAENSKETICQVHESSEGFGEIALLTNALGSVSAITLASAVFASISKTDFNNWLMDYPDLEFKFLPLLSEKLDS